MSEYYFALVRVTDENRKILAANIRGLLAKNGLTEAELARLSGVAQKTINNLANPDGPSPNVETVRKVAHALGLTVDQLYLDGLIDDPAVAQRVRRVVQGLLKLTPEQQEAAVAFIETLGKSNK